MASSSLSAAKIERFLKQQGLQDVTSFVIELSICPADSLPHTTLDKLSQLQRNHVNIFPAIKLLLARPETLSLYAILNAPTIDLMHFTHSERQEIAMVLLQCALMRMGRRYGHPASENVIDAIEAAALRVLKRLGDAGKPAMTEYYRQIEEYETYGSLSEL